MAKQDRRRISTSLRSVGLGYWAVAAALLAGAVLFLPDRASDDSPRSGQVSSAASILDIELANFDGGTVPLSSFVDGRPLVVNFFASWCGPCVREMPDFQKVHEGRDDVRFLGVNLQDTPEAAAELLQQTGVTFDVVQDEEGELYRAVGGISMPTTFFLSAEGQVIDVHAGELTAQPLESLIDRHLGE